MTELSFELRWMIYTALLSLLIWVPYVLAEMQRIGVLKAITYPDQRDMPLWAERLKKAHYNLLENLVPLAIAVIAGEFVGLHTPTTRALVVIFFLARLAHPFAQMTRIPGGRSALFGIGWLVTLIYIFLVLMAGQ